MSVHAGVKKDGYKDYVLPSEAEKLFLLENNKKAIESFRHEISKYLQTLADDVEMANTELMYGLQFIMFLTFPSFRFTFLTYTDKEKLRERLLRIKKQNNLKDL